MPEIALPTKTIQDRIDARVLEILNKVNTGVGKTLRRRRYVSNGTFVVPSGVTEVFITGGGGGGGGASMINASVAPSNGLLGGTTRFGNLLALNGGTGGTGAVVFSNHAPGEAGGAGGEAGKYAINYAASGNNIISGDGGNSGPYFGGRGTQRYVASKRFLYHGGWCSGGAGASNNVSFCAGGGGGDYVEKYPLTVTPLTTYNITIGQGGAGGATGSGVDTVYAGNGGQGIMFVEWWQ